MSYQSKITYNEFCDYLDEIKAVERLDNTLMSACKTFQGKTRYELGIELPFLTDSVIELLEIIFNDKRNAISFFIYELDFGNNHSRQFIDEYGYCVELHSVEDLWNYLMRRD